MEDKKKEKLMITVAIRKINKTKKKNEERKKN